MLVSDSNGLFHRQINFEVTEISKKHIGILQKWLFYFPTLTNIYYILPDILYILRTESIIYGMHYDS